MQQLATSTTLLRELTKIRWYATRIVGMRLRGRGALPIRIYQRQAYAACFLLRDLCMSVQHFWNLHASANPKHQEKPKFLMAGNYQELKTYNE